MGVKKRSSWFSLVCVRVFERKVRGVLCVVYISVMYECMYVYMYV